MSGPHLRAGRHLPGRRWAKKTQIYGLWIAAVLVLLLLPKYLFLRRIADTLQLTSAFRIIFALSYYILLGRPACCRSARGL